MSLLDLRSLVLYLGQVARPYLLALCCILDVAWPLMFYRWGFSLIDGLLDHRSLVLQCWLFSLMTGATLSVYLILAATCLFAWLFL